MTETATILATSIAQAVSAMVVAMLLRASYRHYQKEYLHHWSWSWLWLAVFHSASAMGIALMPSISASHPLRMLSAAASGGSAYLHFGALLVGCYELARRRTSPLRATRGTLLALALFGVAISLIAVGNPSAVQVRYFLLTGLRTLVGGIVFLAAARLVWRGRGNTKNLGFGILAWAFFLYGLNQLHDFTLALVWSFGKVAFVHAQYLGFVDLLLQGVMGVGMFSSLLEDEREASRAAAHEVEHLAYHDLLTGLPNRALFFDRLILALAHAKRHKEKLAICFLDLDRFKEINDTLGHSIGDALLRSVADRIRRCVREEDTLARFGGDEFTLLIPSLVEAEDAAKVAQKTLETIKIPFSIQDHDLFVSASIGISIFPADGTDAETLLKNADTAMYRAKEQGRDTYQLYAAAMNERALERMALENMLRRALENHELILHYQPLVDLATQSIYGAEALVRWKHPELGLLAPAHFIPLAEASGLIIPIGDWVLEEACRQAREWQKRFAGRFIVAVNLSARQFQQPDLVEKIQEVLRKTHYDATQLEIEITESNAMQNAENSIRTLLELKALGVRVSMDDFGTGYSSLSYLKRFPIDTLKLDRSFVLEVPTDETDSAIATAVIAMAHSMKLQVLAEGVETNGQLEFFKQLGCDRIQGYLFSRPLTADSFESLFVEHSANPTWSSEERVLEKNVN